MKPNPLFSSHAILQREVEIPVWGTAEDGERITVEIQGQSVSTTAADGKWMVRLAPLADGGPYVLRVTGDNTVEIDDVFVGEVWLAGGQSNMAWPLIHTDLAGQEIAASEDPLLRVARVPMKQSLTPLDETEISWIRSCPEAAGYFSAVAYHFAKELRRVLGCPVGIIDNSRGGTRIESWMSPQAILPFEDRIVRDIVPPTEEIPVSPHTASNLYNAMTAPLIPYAIRGFIWYQGESNANNAFLYPELFPAMIADWRKAWQLGDIPFLFVQLAPCGQPGLQPEGSKWAEVREAQLWTAQTVPNTAMAVITDHGAEDPHPRHKKTVAERLALAARALAYGEQASYKSPCFSSMRVNEAEVTVEFENAEGGLVAIGDPIKGFSIAGSDGVFHEANAVLCGSAVTLSSDQVPHPVAVRYNWRDRPEATLYNRSGLPASPFRTDSFPRISG